MKHIKDMLEENIKLIGSMDVKEYTLYRKWNEINITQKKWVDSNIQQIDKIKNDIWNPKDLYDYQNLNIKVIYCDTPKLKNDWMILRRFVSTMPANNPPGRQLRFLIVHEELNDEKDIFGFSSTPTWKYLGVICLGSDFISVGGRDNIIGWTQDQKLKVGMLKHTAMASTIVPTQPFGFNYVGGKLISLLTLSDVIENKWNDQYKEKLVGITTTSLYGGYSQYNGLNYWKKCTSSNGEIPIEPSEEVYEKIKDWFKETYPEEYKDLNDKKDKIIVSHPKAKLLARIYSKLKVKTVKNNAPRGVYWATLYNNSNEFLRQEDLVLKEKKFDNSVNTLVSLWKIKHCEKRVKNLLQCNGLNNDGLFYDNIINKTWQETYDFYKKEKKL